MSKDAQSLSPALADYIADRTRKDDEFLVSLQSAAREAGIPSIAISAMQASLIQIMLRATRAREVIEVGTLAGYSAINMARALPDDGHVRTIEFSAPHADFAERWIARSDVAGKVTVLRGDGCDVLKTFDDDCADAAFLDANKSQYPVYLEECLRVVRRGGLILVDNAFAFGQLLDPKPTDPDVGAIRDFNDLMANDARMQSVIVPVGDGMWAGVRL